MENITKNLRHPTCTHQNTLSKAITYSTNKQIQKVKKMPQRKRAQRRKHLNAHEIKGELRSNMGKIMESGYRHSTNTNSEKGFPCETFLLSRHF